MSHRLLERPRLPTYVLLLKILYMLYVYKFSKGRRGREEIEHKENDRGERISNVNLKEKVGIR